MHNPRSGGTVHCSMLTYKHETFSKLVEDLTNKIIGSLAILAIKKGLYLGSNSVCHSINFFDDVRMSSEKQQLENDITPRKLYLAQCTLWFLISYPHTTYVEGEIFNV